MSRLLRLAALGSALFVLGTGSAAADLSSPVTQEQQTANGVLQSFATGIDLTLTDTAVTADQLAVAGVWVDSAPSLLSDPDMLIVDDDRAQCPNAQFQTINAAVTAALPGALIRVCPGLYKESVTINKPLTLQAPRHQGQATECQSPVADDPTQYAILAYQITNGGNPSEGFDVEAPNVTIDGFTVEPDSDHVTHDGVGIFTSKLFAGYDIRHNVVQFNTFGIYVNDDGSAPSYVRENCVRDNNLAGANSGVGIYSDQGISNTQLTNNYATGDEGGSVVVDSFNTAPHDVQITHNTSVSDGPIIAFSSLAPTAFNLIVSYNKVIGSAGSGVVTLNVMNSQISYNDVENGVNNGISLHETTNSVVQSNKATGFQLDGVRIGDESDNNLVATNRAENNVQAGLQATGDSRNNTIRENHMRGNHTDCSDNTLGSGTAGTANFWINDTGYTEDHPGICKHATP